MAHGRKTGGRRKGTPNKATAGIREIARGYVDAPAYREALKQRLLQGEAGAMEATLWAYAYGKPPLTGDDGGAAPTSITITF